jgi:RHS repeat-associated protein
VFDGQGNQQNRYLYGTQIDQVLVDETPTQMVWVLADNQGTVRDIVDNNGDVIQHLSYDSFGKITNQTNTSFDFRYGYTGRELDVETGDYYYRARYYDSGVGRFISEDPIGFEGGDSNLSRYVFNSPTNYTDPSGNIPVLLIVGGVVVSYALEQALFPDHAQVPTAPCDYHPTPPDQELKRLAVGLAGGQLQNLGTPFLRTGGNYLANGLGSLGRNIGRLNSPGLVPVPVGGRLGNELGDLGNNLLPSFGKGLGPSTGISAGTGLSGLSPSYLASTSGGGGSSTPSSSLPAGSGGTGANYDKINGQGLYVLKDSNGNVKYVGRGDVPQRLSAHSNTPGKEDLEATTLFNNTLQKAQAKGLEQRLIDNFGGAQSQNPSTPLLNKIRSFSPANPNAQNYTNAATDDLWAEMLRRVNSP